jgi:hypothetical protein
MSAAIFGGFRHGRVVLVSQWSQEDYASVQRAGRELHARAWRKAFSINEMLQAYESVVGRIEEGYDETVYEYLNDLACRRWLALAWPLVTENVRQSRAADLRSLDDRFRAATTDDGGRSLSRFFKVEGASEWWWRRRPVKARGDFAADLAEDD